MKIIEKTLSLFYTVDGYYPLPDNRTNMTYSGGVAWYQGVFGSGVVKQAGRISEAPVDATNGLEYSY